MFKNVMLAVAAFAFLTQINPILGDDVEDLLKKLDASVNDAIAKANATLEQTKAILNEFAQNIVRTGKSMIYDTLSQHKASLDTLKRMAKKTGVNIDDCLGDVETALRTLAKTSTKDIVDCEAKKINEAFEYVQDAFNETQTALSSVENFRQEVKDCGSVLEEEECLAELTQKVEDAITTLPSDIVVGATASAEQIIYDSKNELGRCVTDAHGKYYTATLTLIEKIEDCVVTKITT